MYGKKDYERLANISHGHFYRLRSSDTYKEKSITIGRTISVSRAIGIRKKPQPDGKPGYIRAAFGDNVRLFNTVFNVLKEPLKVTRVGRVTQSVTPVAITSGLETEVALIPFIKTKTTITSTADIAKSDDGSWELRMDKIAVKDGILAQFPGIPIRAITSFLERIPQFETPKAVVNVTYVDQDLRIIRDQDSNVFVYTRIAAKP